MTSFIKKGIVINSATLENRTKLYCLIYVVIRERRGTREVTR